MTPIGSLDSRFAARGAAVARYAIDTSCHVIVEGVP